MQALGRLAGRALPACEVALRHLLLDAAHGVAGRLRHLLIALEGVVDRRLDDLDGVFLARLDVLGDVVDQRRQRVLGFHQVGIGGLLEVLLDVGDDLAQLLAVACAWLHARLQRADSVSIAAFGSRAWLIWRLAASALSIEFFAVAMFSATTCSTPCTALLARALKVCICRSNRVLVALANCSGFVNIGVSSVGFLGRTSMF
jgi:hypothetical protein